MKNDSSTLPSKRRSHTSMDGRICTTITGLTVTGMLISLHYAHAPARQAAKHHGFILPHIAEKIKVVFLTAKVVI